MALLTPPPVAPQRGDRTTFAGRVDAFITWLINFVSELLALVSSLNSIAAGGAYAIPYTIGAVGDVGWGGSHITFDGGSQNSSPHVFVDNKSADGHNVSGLLLSMVAGATSAVKGTLRIQKQGDPSKFLVYSVTALVDDTTPERPYKYFNSACIDSSSRDPFVVGDAVMLFFQRNGDKGDPGASGNLPSIYVRQELAAGTSAEALVSGAWTARNLNTTKWNDISGASVASGVVTLPAGTYEVEASAPATSSNGHKIRLYNVTDSAVADVGFAAYALNTGGMSRAHLRTRFTLAAPKAFRIDHYVAIGATMAGAGGSAIEVYSEFKATKVA